MRAFLEMKGNSSHEIWVSRELYSYYFLLVLLDVSVARVGAATLRATASGRAARAAARSAATL